MATIYFNTRFISIESKNINNSEYLYHYQEIHSLSEIVYTFINDISIPYIIIIYHDIDEVIHKIQAMFTYIVAAGGLVTNKKNELLCIYRLEKWDLPKGKAEKKETIQQTALREVSEECGLNVEDISIENELPSTFHTYPYKNTIAFKRTYWFSMKYSGNYLPKPQIEEQISAIEWIPVSQLKKVKANTYQSILDVLNAYMNS